MRPVYAESSQYPRYIRDDRGPTWTKANLEINPEGLKEKWVAEKTAILGYIPQVAHTYEVLEGEYGFMNEHQVSMGESTCAVMKLLSPHNIDKRYRYLSDWSFMCHSLCYNSVSPTTLYPKISLSYHASYVGKAFCGSCWLARWQSTSQYWRINANWYGTG